MGQYQADILTLIREAYNAQEAFDNWDEGRTVGGFCVGAQRTARYVDLEQVVQELDEAVLTLIGYVEAHGQSIKDDIMGGKDGEEAKD